MVPEAAGMVMMRRNIITRETYAIDYRCASLASTDTYEPVM